MAKTYNKTYHYKNDENEKVTSTFTRTNCPLAFKSGEIRDKFSETFDELIQIAKPLL